MIDIILEQNVQSVPNNRVTDAFDHHLTDLMTGRMSTPAVKSAILQQDVRGIAESAI